MPFLVLIGFGIRLSAPIRPMVKYKFMGIPIVTFFSVPLFPFSSLSPFTFLFISHSKFPDPQKEIEAIKKRKEKKFKQQTVEQSKSRAQITMIEKAELGRSIEIMFDALNEKFIQEKSVSYVV